MNYDLALKIENALKSGKENDQFDFKQEWHKENERLLHDILCFANTVHNRDCYIIFGVSDDKKLIGVNGKNRKKQADLLDMLANVGFAGDYTPKVAVDTLRVGYKEIDVLTIFNSFDVPYYIKKKPTNYNSIREGYIYMRIGDKNTPINQNAPMPDIEMLWKKRLGLTMPPLEQIKQRLANKLEWVSSEEGYYNTYKPDFQLLYQEDEEDERLAGEFYVYSQTNSHFLYSNIKVMFNITVLDRFQLISLDSGRYTTPVPTWSFLGKDEHINPLYIYKYYLKNSFAYQLQQFLFNEDNSEQVWAKHKYDEVILYFDNDTERILFEAYVLENSSLISEYLREADEHYYTLDSGNQLVNAESRKRLSMGLALNKALSQFRDRETGGKMHEA
ncbi:hypothetical protein SDC9_42792 [bioreactor metagenome]|uniref:Schlafen AlbA-2 domain-containing protein n=1 Tax=bioreactor metagenome TaxID=1076179 RepID=A0A644VZM7_9ZZZZ